MTNDVRGAAPDPSTRPDSAGEHLSLLPVTPAARGAVLLVTGVVGLVAAFVLVLERLALAEHPDRALSCDINPFISCATVMRTPQAALLGFPNPLLGVAAFPVVVLLGVLVLARTPLPRWVEQGFLVGTALALVLVGWFVSQALFSIRALCPYCMVVWAAVVPLFWTTLADALDRGLLPVPRGLRPSARVLVDYRVLAVVLTYALVVALVVVAFWSSWTALL